MDFKKFLTLIIIEQTIFALPFAFIGILFAGKGNLKIWILVIIALTAARTAGMSFNRVIDAKIDAKNPRTTTRLVPKGEVSTLSVWILAIVTSMILIVTSFLLNKLCFYLSFLAIFLLFTYSYFKRFSVSSHFYLGLVEASAPIGGYLAVTGNFSVVPFILGFVILTWIAGLDIIYSLQDMEFDKKENLHSVPSKFGKKKALRISLQCYAASIGTMILAGIITDKHLPYWAAILFIFIIFSIQQKIARDEQNEFSVKYFFKINMFISPAFFLGTLLDVFLW